MTDIIKINDQTWRFEEEGVRKVLTELSGAPEKTNDTGKKGLFSRLFG